MIVVKELGLELLEPRPTKGPVKSLLSVWPSVHLFVCGSVSLAFFSEIGR